MYHNLGNYSCINGHLGCSLIFFDYKQCCNEQGCVSLKVYLQGKIPDVQFLGQKVRTSILLLDFTKPSYERFVVCIPTSNVREYFPKFTSQIYCHIFHFSNPMGKIWYLKVVLVCIPLITRNFEQFSYV